MIAMIKFPPASKLNLNECTFGDRCSQTFALPLKSFSNVAFIETIFIKFE